MNLNAIVYRMPPGSSPVSLTVNIDEKVLSKGPFGVELPAVLVLREHDLAGREDFCEVGHQHAGKELASILMNRKEDLREGKPFVLKGKYQSVGTLNNAMRKFLDRAKGSDERKAYFICIDEDLYGKIVKNLSDVESAPSEATRREELRKPHPVATRLSRDEELAKNLLELMERDQELRDDRIVRNRYRGVSYGCRLVRQRILMAAGNDLTVMIAGERGTGKEEVAKAIRDLGKRKDAPFIVINCSAISPNLLEAELFGVEKDYPNKGTPKKIGLWVAAGEGTLFLDEIGELAPDHQAKILRTLETKKILPVGAVKEEEVHARVIAATNRNMESRDKYGKHLFRQDLYDRLKQIYIRTPNLKSHPEDIPDYATHIWKGITRGQPAILSTDLIDLLMKQNWDDNVRGLRNVLEDLHRTFPTNPTAEKLQLVLLYRKDTEEMAITTERLVTPELNDMIEILAKASHEAWYRKRKEEGYVLGPNMTLPDGVKTNPNLKPYHELSEAQKSYPREEARAILKAILDEGYSIVK